MHRVMEDPKKAPNISRGTLEGQIRPGPATFFRLQGDPDGRADAATRPRATCWTSTRTASAAIGVFAIPNFARFYRHVLVGRHFPHHGAVAFSKCGKVLFDAVSLMGVDDISVPLPKTMLYAGENPFEVL